MCAGHLCRITRPAPYISFAATSPLRSPDQDAPSPRPLHTRQACTPGSQLPDLLALRCPPPPRHAPTLHTTSSGERVTDASRAYVRIAAACDPYPCVMRYAFLQQTAPSARSRASRPPRARPPLVPTRSAIGQHGRAMAADADGRDKRYTIHRGSRLVVTGDCQPRRPGANAYRLGPARCVSAARAPPRRQARSRQAHAGRRMQQIFASVSASAIAAAHTQESAAGGGPEPNSPITRSR
ncbi:hypothetical protein C8R47DRAFT_1223543 [Mycena vitilis]|nr:hypothetical protein C8R47DRAFT_1223543 [Mycena vitilis]